MSKYNNNSLQIGRLATFATLAEALSAPSPGLVNRLNNGSHKDMNIYTFAASSTILSDYFIDAAEQGFISKTNKGNKKESLDKLFEKINHIGRSAERDMWENLRVNTHKGTIYILLLLCCAAGMCLYENGKINISFVCNAAGCLARDQIKRELINSKKLRREELSTGLSAYLDFGFLGIRGEVLSNFRLCREVGLPTITQCINEGATLNDALVHCLFVLMAENEDTTLLNRSYQAENIALVNTWSKKVISAGSLFTIEGKKCIKEFEKIIKKRNLSPGGSADIVSGSFFLFLLNCSEKGGYSLGQLLTNGNSKSASL